MDKKGLFTLASIDVSNDGIDKWHEAKQKHAVGKSNQLNE